MKYNFKPVPDPHGDGFVKTFIEGKSTILNRIYRLEIDFDLCAPIETWTLYNQYESVTNGKRSTSSYNQQVYHGRELTPEQRDMMVELVMEYEYLDYGEYVNPISSDTTNAN